jgi:hypothetical protein
MKTGGQQAQASGRLVASFTEIKKDGFSPLL